MDIIARRAKRIKKIVLCYDDSLPAKWLIGAGKLRGKLERAGIEVGGSTLLIRRHQGKRAPIMDLALGVDLINAPIHELPADADIILAPAALALRARRAAPRAQVIPVSQFLVNPVYDEIVTMLRDESGRAGAGRPQP